MTDEARPRVIALGASNLTRLLPAMMRVRSAACEQRSTACEWFVAAGLGRSYGLRSRLLGRQLPGMDGCGLWPALAAAEPVAATGSATGIVTDVGNDIFYGVEVEQVLAWVEHALQRLRPFVDRLVITGVPPSVFELGALRFWVMRRIIVPSCKLDLAEGKRRATALHEGLRALAERYQAVFLIGQRHWYGWDAIHVKRRHWRTFVEQLLGVPRARVLPRLPSHRGRFVPELRWMFGREQRAEQPAVQWSDGTTLSIY
ncbi:MAG: hypothetical protein ACI89X_001633 [Planctomycetota bacterium]